MTLECSTDMQVFAELIRARYTDAYGNGRVKISGWGFDTYYIIYIYTGWWFGSIFIFHNIWDVILRIDELIFFKMVKTTNQYILCICVLYSWQDGSNSRTILHELVMKN